jgi:hypothetical protein
LVVLLIVLLTAAARILLLLVGTLPAATLLATMAALAALLATLILVLILNHEFHSWYENAPAFDQRARFADVPGSVGCCQFVLLRKPEPTTLTLNAPRWGDRPLQVNGHRIEMIYSSASHEGVILSHRKQSKYPAADNRN